MRATHGAVLGLAAALLVTAAAGCNRISNPGFELDCAKGPCNWEVVEGAVYFGPGWHDGDDSADFSYSDRATIEQVQEDSGPWNEDLLFEAAVALDPGVSIRFELSWSDHVLYGYDPGNGAGDRDTRVVTVSEPGVQRIRQVIARPNGTPERFTIRITKTGRGLGIVDELLLVDVSEAEWVD